MQKLIIYVCCLTLLGTSCSPRTTYTTQIVTPDKTKENLNDNLNDTPITQSELFDFYKTLTQAEYPNIALAEALATLLKEQDPALVINLRRQMQDQGFDMPDVMDEQWQQTKKLLIVGPSSALNNKALLQNTVNLNLKTLEKSNSFDVQINTKVIGYTQSLALQSILKSYDEQVKSDSASIAGDIVAQLKESRPALLDKIDATKNSKNRDEQIEKIIIYLKQADQLFIRYGVSDADASKLILYSAVAGVMASTIAQHVTVQKLIKVGQRLNDLADQAKKIITLVREVQSYGEQFANHSRALKLSMDQVYTEAKKMDLSIENDDIKLSPDGKKAAKAILDDVLNGNFKKQISSDEIAKELNIKGFFEKERKLRNSVQNFVNAADGSVKAFDNILATSLQITAALRIKLSPNVVKAIDVANKISKGVQLASAVSTAFSTGGFVGALGAFSGGPATMALAAFGGLGGGGPDPAIMADLAEIKQSLAEIKEMQKEISENQKKTMMMIKDLALMVEEYHRVQMKALTDIKEEVLNVKDGVSEIDISSFKSCQVMTSYPLEKSGYFANHDLNSSDLQNLNSTNLDAIKSVIRDTLTSPKELVGFIKSGSSENFKNCQKEMSHVFLAENSLKFDRALWGERDQNKKDDGRKGGEIVREYYTPALNYLKEKTSGKKARWEKLLLHLPVTTASALKVYKESYLNTLSSHGNVNENNLQDLNNLTATYKLEQYISSLLVLYPYITLDYETWVQQPLESILKEAVSEETHERSRQMLSNAFKRVQHAIAQESILSGEPLLPYLFVDWQSIVSETKNCSPTEEARYCFVRKNNVIMQNLLVYLLTVRIGEFGEDEDARNTRKAKYDFDLISLKDLAGLLSVPEDRLMRDEQNDVYLFLSADKTLKVKIPDAQQIEFGNLQYTDSMSRMVKLEHKIADELLKISPTSYPQKMKNILPQIMLLN